MQYWLSVGGVLIGSIRERKTMVVQTLCRIVQDDREHSDFLTA